jgi:hypothetical protein
MVALSWSARTPSTRRARLRRVRAQLLGAARDPVPHSCDTSCAPPAGVVRGSVAVGGMLLTPTNGGRSCHCVYILRTDIGGQLPSYIVSAALSAQALTVVAVSKVSCPAVSCRTVFCRAVSLSSPCSSLDCLLLLNCVQLYCAARTDACEEVPWQSAVGVLRADGE